MESLQEQRSLRLRQRLWGAAVLIALLVVFLPLLLDGSGSESQYRRVERLRAEPPRIINSSDENSNDENSSDENSSDELASDADSAGDSAVIPVSSKSGRDRQSNQGGQAQQGDQAGQASQGDQAGQASQGDQAGQASQGDQAGQASRGDQTGQASQGDQAGQASQGDQAGQASQGDRAGQAQQGDKAGQTQEGDQGRQNAKSEPLIDDGKSTDADSASEGRADNSESNSKSPDSEPILAWVVQAGSFADEDNALAVRDKLRRAGYPSFVTPTDTQPPVYRVRVGPMIDLQQAESKRDKVIEYLGREAIVVSYP